jgi:hypothetical protein
MKISNRICGCPGLVVIVDDNLVGISVAGHSYFYRGGATALPGSTIAEHFLTVVERFPDPDPA